MKILEKFRKIISGMAIFAMTAPMLFVGATPAIAATPFPSTNAQNIINNWAHVDVSSTALGSVTLDFVNPRAFWSCFEYRTDGDTSQKTSDTNFNTAVVDGLYPYFCQNNNNKVKTFNAQSFVEVRLAFGAEGDERFDWTKFEVGKDTTKPLVSVVKPLADQSFKAAVEILLQASDPETDISAVKMNIYKVGSPNVLVPGCTGLAASLDGLLWKKTINDGGSCSLPSDGTYQIAAWATNGAGLSGWAPRSNFIIDTVRPTLSVITPTSGKILSSKIDISVFASDLVSDISSASMHIYKVEESGNNLVAGCTSIPTIFSGTYWVTTINNGGSCLLTDGTYQIAAWAYDEAGNPGWAARTNFIVDSTPPVVNIDSPTVSKVNGMIQIMGTVTDANPSHYYLVIKKMNGSIAAKVDSDGIVYRGDSFNNQLLWMFNTEVLPDGEYNIVLEARDLAGNKDEGSVKTHKIIVDNTAPTIPSLFSPFNESFVNGNTLTNDWSDSPESDVHHYVYESYNNASATSIRWSQVVNAPTSQKTATNVANTTFWWRVKAVDNLGNISDWSDLWKVTVDNNAPAISAHEKITVEATSADGTIVSYVLPTATDAVDGTVLVVCSPISGTLFPLGITNVNCSATDTGGHTANSLFQITVVDTTAPVITVTGGDLTIEAGGAYIEQGATWADIVDISGSVSDISGTVNNLVPDDYTITYSITDTAGNTATSTRTVTVVDTTAPVITLNGDISYSLTVGGPFTDPGAVTDDGSLVTVNGAVNNLVAGTYTITYDATDASGNVASSVTRTVTVNAAPGFAVATTDGGIGTTGEVAEVAGATTENVTTPDKKTDDNGSVKGTDDSENWTGVTVLGMARWVWLMLILALLIGFAYWWLVLGQRRMKDDKRK